MLNNTIYPSTQRAHRAFYFNPEGQVGGGTIPTETNEPELQRVPAPEEEPSTETETETETTPPGTTH